MGCGFDNVFDARKRAEELRSQINYHDYLYYVKNALEISDAQYDELMQDDTLFGRVMLYFEPGQRHLVPVDLDLVALSEKQGAS